MAEPSPWAGFNLSPGTLSTINAQNYQKPTPIQEKCIPLILEGNDVIAMARTGSGKTAAFLLPVIERLLARNASTASLTGPGSSVKCLIVSPTRELALQTFAFAKLFAGPNLKVGTVIGGDSMSSQFSLMHSTNTDIVIAVPGRLMHILTEMNISKLKSVEYLIFDEADRLFENNFQIQMNEILARCSNEKRKTFLFSATMPPKIAQFAKAGLVNPAVVRIDSENKLPEKIELEFIYTRPDEKYSVLVYLLRRVIEHEDTNEQTIIFAATKYHVEYISKLLTELSIQNTLLFSSLPQANRLENMQKFRDKEVNLLVCTDVAARGVDIPELDNVIHFHFTPQGKTFIHRCGRVCRAGSERGKAISILSSEELPYVIEVANYINRVEDLNENSFRLPLDELNIHTEAIDKLSDSNLDVNYLRKLAKKSEKQYYKTRPSARHHFVKQAKSLLENFDQGQGLKIYHSYELTDIEEKRLNMIDQLKNYRSGSSIFEIGTNKNNMAKAEVVRKFRSKHSGKRELSVATATSSLEGDQTGSLPAKKPKFELTPYTPKKNITTTEKATNLKAPIKREVLENLNYLTETASVSTLEKIKSTDKDSAGLVSENQEDIMTKMLKKRAGIKETVQKKWDGKKYVRVDAGNTKYMKSLAGQKLKASFKKNTYEKWLQKKGQGIDDDDDNDQGPSFSQAQFSSSTPRNPKQALKIKKVKIDKTKLGFRKKNEGFNEVRNRQQVAKFHKVEKKKRDKELYNQKKHAQRQKSAKGKGRGKKR